ncbi:MAG TPA: hypothetical protein VKE70_13155 [Candidatus Solibacter sp.]|nr:hypothetical protein [Candidatus Solibacter sp.]
MKRERQPALAGDPSWCYLCGLPIPSEIVSHAHPLFETVDHLIATSRNGRDALFNRAPAHRICSLATA